MAKMWRNMFTCEHHHNSRSHNLFIVKIHVNNVEDSQGFSWSLLIITWEISGCSWCWRFIFRSFEYFFKGILKNSRKRLTLSITSFTLVDFKQEKKRIFKDVNPRKFEFNENCFRAGGDGDASRWLWNAISRLLCSSNEWKMFFFYEYWITSMWEDRKKQCRVILEPSWKQITPKINVVIKAPSKFAPSKNPPGKQIWPSWSVPPIRCCICCRQSQENEWGKTGKSCWKTSINLSFYCGKKFFAYFFFGCEKKNWFLLRGDFFLLVMGRWIRLNIYGKCEMRNWESKEKFTRFPHSSQWNFTVHWTAFFMQIPKMIQTFSDSSISRRLQLQLGRFLLSAFIFMAVNH